MGKIAIRAYCNTLKSGAFSSELTRCPTKGEIEAVGLTVLNTYATNQMVMEEDIVVSNQTGTYNLTIKNETQASNSIIINSTFTVSGDSATLETPDLTSYSYRFTQEGGYNYIDLKKIRINYKGIDDSGRYIPISAEIMERNTTSYLYSTNNIEYSGNMIDNKFTNYTLRLINVQYYGGTNGTFKFSLNGAKN